MAHHEFTETTAKTPHICDAWVGTDAQWMDWSGRRKGTCKALIAKGENYFRVSVKGQGRFDMCSRCRQAERIIWPDVPFVPR